MHTLKLYTDKSLIEKNEHQTVVDVYWALEVDEEKLSWLSRKNRPIRKGRINAGPGKTKVEINLNYSNENQLLAAAEYITSTYLLEFAHIFGTPKKVSSDMMKIEFSQESAVRLINSYVDEAEMKELFELQVTKGYFKCIMKDADLKYVKKEDNDWIKDVKKAALGSIDFVSENSVFNAMRIQNPEFGAFIISPVALEKFALHPTESGTKRPYKKIRDYLEMPDNLTEVFLDKEKYKQKRNEFGQVAKIFRSEHGGVFFSCLRKEYGGQPAYLVKDIYIRYSGKINEKYIEQIRKIPGAAI